MYIHVYSTERLREVLFCVDMTHCGAGFSSREVRSQELTSNYTYIKNINNNCHRS